MPGLCVDKTPARPCAFYGGKQAGLNSGKNANVWELLVDIDTVDINLSWVLSALSAVTMD